jgi:hypothetical protein
VALPTPSEIVNDSSLSNRVWRTVTHSEFWRSAAHVDFYRGCLGRALLSGTFCATALFLHRVRGVPRADKAVFAAARMKATDRAVLGFGASCGVVVCCQRAG